MNTQRNPRVHPERLTEALNRAYQFHCELPGYRPSPLVPLPTAGSFLGLNVVAKVEKLRFGVPSFKGLGTTWAVSRLLSPDHPAGQSVKELVAATEGNFGLAIAAASKANGLGARIYSTASILPSRQAAILELGAELTLADGAYESVVERARAASSDHSFWASDTALDPGERFPQWVQEGYSTIAFELVQQLENESGTLPAAVVVPIGVGGLAAALISVLRPRGVRVIGVETRKAAAALESIREGRMVTASGQGLSVMQGLNCRQLSAVAWPAIRDGLDLCVAIADSPIQRARASLAEAGISTGPAGAAAFAGLLELGENDLPALRALHIEENPTVVVLVSESERSIASDT